MIKADKKVSFKDEKEKEQFEDYTYFEEVRKRVEILQETIDEVVAILKANNIVMKKEIEAPYFDEDEVYRRLAMDE